MTITAPPSVVATTATFTADTLELRAALKAVAAHASPDAEDRRLYRVRFALAGQAVGITATNGFTAAHARISVENRYLDDLTVDLSPQDVKEVLTIHNGKGSEVAGEQQVRVDVRAQHVTFTDCSGLFDGKSLQLVRYPDTEDYPDVPALIGRTLRQPFEPVERLITAGPMLRLFTTTAAAYGEPLLVEPHGAKGALVVACGEHFIGLLMPMSVGGLEDVQQQQRWREAWLTDLPYGPGPTGLQDVTGLVVVTDDEPQAEDFPPELEGQEAAFELPPVVTFVPPKDGTVAT